MKTTNVSESIKRVSGGGVAGIVLAVAVVVGAAVAFGSYFISKKKFAA